MKKILGITLLALTLTVSAQKFRNSSSKISFLSDAPLEDIYAESKKSTSVFNASEKKIVVLIKTNTLVFKNPMMQEHFQEDYIESDKFPNATLTGDVLGDFDVTKDGSYDVIVKGKLKIHGVEKELTIPFTFSENAFKSKFSVNRLDYNVGTMNGLMKKVSNEIKLEISIPVSKL